jgi:pyruvate formate lyase activating enzyme
MNTAEHEALFARREGDRAICLLCPHGCSVAPGHSGLCKARRNSDGRLLAWSYGKITSLALDPIEKKPLYRFYPGSRILSVGSFGCNFRCDFCQNWQIAQREAAWRLIEPEEMAGLAVQAGTEGNIGLAYTYNEPLVGYEYVLDCARLIHGETMKNVLVTNGYINPEPLRALLPVIDAMNIDLKAWNADFYARICGGRIDPVLETIRISAACCHVEITTLLIPGLNDDESDIEALAGWLASLSPDIPLHLTRHHPDYRMAEPGPISRARLEKLAAVARKSLKYVWLGNI